jgi:hypothetical protein
VATSPTGTEQALRGRLVRLRSRVCNLMLSFAILWSGQAHAQTTEADLPRLKDHEQTLKLERALVRAVQGQDRRTIARLASNILLKDLPGLEIFAQTKNIDDLLPPHLALKMGPCHLAGIAIRTIIVGFANQRLKARQGTSPLEITPNGVELMFVEHMRRCELVILRIPLTQRLIGTSCAVDGKNCRDD